MGNFKPMTRTQYESHAEQMDASRAEFQKQFSKHRAFLESARVSSRLISREEHKAWTKWLKAHPITNPSGGGA